MIKSLAPLTIFALLGASVIALPGFAPKVQAHEAPVMAKGDRLEFLAPVGNCLKEVWPDLSSSCLLNKDSRKVVEARLVTASR